MALDIGIYLIAITSGPLGIIYTDSTHGEYITDSEL